MLHSGPAGYGSNSHIGFVPYHEIIKIRDPRITHEPRNG